MGTLNARQIDTTPGSSSGPFTPPEGWTGSGQEYTRLMRARYKNDLMHSQRMALIGWCARWNPAECSGPFAEEASRIIEALASRVPKPLTKAPEVA